MIEEREIFALLFALFAIAIAARNRKTLSTLPAFPLLAAAGIVLALGLAVTLLEGFFWESGLNAIEHAAYGSSSLLLSIWAWTALGRSEPPERRGLSPKGSPRKGAGS